MAKGQFHHFGVPTSSKQENEIYLEGGGVYITDCNEHPYKVEYLRFDPDSGMPDDIKNSCHAAFMVDNLDQAMEDETVILEPFNATEELRVGFIKQGDAVIELMEEIKHRFSRAV